MKHQYGRAFPDVLVLMRRLTAIGTQGWYDIYDKDATTLALLKSTADQAMAYINGKSS